VINAQHSLLHHRIDQQNTIIVIIVRRPTTYYQTSLHTEQVPHVTYMQPWKRPAGYRITELALEGNPLRSQHRLMGGVNDLEPDQQNKHVCQLAKDEFSISRQPGQLCQHQFIVPTSKIALPATLHIPTSRITLPASLHLCQRPEQISSISIRTSPVPVHHHSIVQTSRTHCSFQHHFKLQAPTSNRPATDGPRSLAHPFLQGTRNRTHFMTTPKH